MFKNGMYTCDCCGDTIKPDEIAYESKDVEGNIVHICIDCEDYESELDDDYMDSIEDKYADEIDAYYDEELIESRKLKNIRNKLKESTFELTEEQKNAIKEMVQMDFETGHPADDANELRTYLADDEMFNANMNTIDSAVKYYMELIAMGPVGIMDEIEDGWSKDYISEYGDNDPFDATGHEKIGICPTCGLTITDEDVIDDDTEDSGKHFCPRCGEIYESHEDLDLD